MLKTEIGAPRRAHRFLLRARNALACLTLGSLGPALVIGCDAGDSSDDEDGAGASPSVAGMTGTGGSRAGAPSFGGGPTGATSFGNPVQEGQNSTTARYEKSDVRRDNVWYKFMANGWGPNFESHNITWNGTAFTVVSTQGRQGGNYEPASYPTMFYGVYSDSVSMQSSLPLPLTSITSLRTGWKWRPNGNTGQYNSAYDVWLGDGTSVSGHKSFLMVWLRDPPGQQPAGMVQHRGVTVANVPGTWNVWVGQVSNKPCISYVRAEGQDTYELEFDVMDFVRDTSTRSIQLPGSHILSVAVGFEIWNGPITNLYSDDFYVKVN
jgi:hypothetical protein